MIKVSETKEAKEVDLRVDFYVDFDTLVVVQSEIGKQHNGARV
jgi:hypothetical protein